MKPILLLSALLALAAIAVTITLVLLTRRRRAGSNGLDSPEKAAGRRGEVIASGYIKYVLRAGDWLLTNVSVSFEGRQTELDNVIINRNGVFIVEVKNYSGKLRGRADDFEWKKYHTSDVGRTYVKKVKNPLKQVRRQTYILASYLRSRGADVWVSGYVFLLQGNSPVSSRYVLTSDTDIDRALHTAGRTQLCSDRVRAIVRLLTGEIEDKPEKEQ